MTSLPSYLRDTRDILQCLSVIKDLDEDMILATMDVTSLHLTLRVSWALKYYAESVLTKNYFLFEKRFHLQIEGTAMGATMAPDMQTYTLVILKINIS